jgi:cob(I)alamin adenosyltransferase
MQRKQIQIILHVEKKSKIMVISSSNSYSKNIPDVVEISSSNKINLKKYTQNGQIQIYQSSYRGSYSSIISDSMRNAALGRKVLLVQFMKGGVKQGINNAVKLCGNLTWIRSSHSFDQNLSEEIENNENLKKSIHESTYELWNFCKKELLSGENDQIILDEIFLAIDMKIIDKDDLISTLENRLISGDVILTGKDIPKDLLLMANQITELRS